MSNSSNLNRNIRVFISSTFSDLQSERDYLIKRVFPRLQMEAAKRNVSITPLDLRWGVTDEESRNGKVLQICLQEIENSHPFFIGLVGNRYGWCPTKEELKMNAILRERWGEWLERDISEGLSVTEIEMQYGVLRSKDDLDAFFYIKQGGDDDVANIEKLELLRTTIRNNGKYPVKEYDTPESLGMYIEKSFMELLDKRYPIVDITEYDKNQYANDAFLHSLIKGYVENTENTKAIDDFLASPERHLVITGERGCGKSALIANWIRNHSENEYNILYHFIGNGVHTSDSDHIIDFICEGVRRLYQLRADLDDSNKGSKKHFDNILNQVSDKKPLLIILDGMDRILDVDSAKLLNWLPYAHKGVKMLFSTVSTDETFKSFIYRKFPIYELIPLNNDDRKVYIRRYLEKFGRHLIEHQIEEIACDPQNENMLVLRTMLDELLCYGIHEKLNERIRYYLEPNSIDDFFQQVLLRYENDFPVELVKNALSLIAFSRSGLQESEIIEMTSVTPLLWSQFYCAFHNNLIISGGFVTFSHSYIADAVKKRYYDNEEYCRLKIIRYFGGSKTNRSKYELPYQLLKLKRYDMLYLLLLIPDVFQYHLFTDRRELAAYWLALLQKDSNKYRLSKYLDENNDYNLSEFFETPEELSKYYYSIGYFISEFFSDYGAVLESYTRSISLIDPVSKEAATIYNNIGYIYGLVGQYDESLAAHQRALDIRLRLFEPDNIYIAQSYSGIGFIYDKLGKYEKALECFQKSLSIHRMQSHGVEDVFVANDYNNIGHVLTNLGRLQDGLEYEKKALTVRQVLLGDNNFDTAMSYHNVGAVLFLMDKLQEATSYLKTASDIWVSILGEHHPQVATGMFDVGCLYRRLGQLKEAVSLMERALKIRIVTIKDSHPDTINNFNTLADICFQMQDYEKSNRYYRELHRILSNDSKHLDPDYSGQIIALGGIGMSYSLSGDYENGEIYLMKAISLCESYTPQNRRMLIGLQSNLYTTRLRKKQALLPNEPIKIVVDIDKEPRQSDSSEHVTQSQSGKGSLIKRILKALMGE